MKTKLTKRKTSDNLNYRSFSMRLESGKPSTLNEEERSVEVVGATEDAVEVFDYDRWEIVPEVLLMSGLEMPKSRQVPLFDTHRRYDTASLLGSYRDMEVSNDQLLGRVHFSTVPEAESQYTKVREGHLTDFSVGYKPIRSEWVPAGEKVTIQGHSYEGPVKVTTRWRVKELSCVPIGADEQAKARSDADEEKNKNKGDLKMNKKTRAFLESRGLPKDATEEEAYAFLERMEKPKEVDNGDGKKSDVKKTVDVDKIRKEATGEERDRIIEIDAACRHFDCADLSDKLIADGTSVKDAYRKIVDETKKKRDDDADNLGHRTPVEITRDARDRFRAAAEDGLLIRASKAPEKPAEGALDLAGYSLRELARHALQIAGLKTGGQPLEMIGRALTTSDLPYILANVANKSLFVGWDTADETWSVWCGTGQVSDFKTHYSPRISEASDLEEVPEHGEYKYGKRTEAQESYAIATYGKLFSISRQAIINDDLGALTNIPASHGESAARKVGDVVYAVLTANAAMGDGVALFHANHSNFVAGGSGAIPGVATIAAGILAMGTHKDLQGLRRLNIRPEHMIAPKALEGAAEVFYRAEKWDDSNKAATTPNPYAGQYFTRVYEPRLDDADAAAWYLAARKGKTVIAHFLNGVEAPYMETKEGWSVDGVEYKVRIDVGAKAMDYRGLYYNDGN